MPKFLDWFETILAHNPAGDAHLVGNALSYADLSPFQVVEGLLYAFPKKTRSVLADCPRVARLSKMVAHRRASTHILLAIAG